MSQSTHIGYGPFRLSDFCEGEIFARFDSSLARVCDPQPPGRPDHVQVVTFFGTSHARKEWLHKSAQAFATDEESAWIIERRRKGESS